MEKVFLFETLCGKDIALETNKMLRIANLSLWAYEFDI